MYGVLLRTRLPLPAAKHVFNASALSSVEDQIRDVDRWDGGLAIIADGWAADRTSNRKLHLRHVSPWTALGLGARQKGPAPLQKKKKLPSFVLNRTSSHQGNAKQSQAKPIDTNCLGGIEQIVVSHCIRMKREAASKQESL